MTGVTKASIVNCIRGAFCADAASMGTHWIYDPAEMLKAVTSPAKPEFRDPPTPSFYSSADFPNHYGPGQLSPYGEQLLFCTEHVAASETVASEKMSDAMLTWAETFGGRPDSALKTFVENKKAGKKDCGADDHEAHIYMKIVPVTCLYVGQQERREKVEEAIRVHQNNDQAVEYGLAASDILEKVLLGESVADVLNKVLQDGGGAPAASLEQAQKYHDFEKLLIKISNDVMADKPDSPFYNLAGRSCSLPGSFTAPIWLLANHADSFEQGLRLNIMGAGDTCSRAVFVGSILGVKNGVPEAWWSKVEAHAMARIDAAANKIADLAMAKQKEE